MTKLYIPLEEKEVLGRVVKALSKVRFSLAVVQGEEDTSSVQPDEKYFAAMENLIDKGIVVRRFYFGCFEKYLREKAQNPQIEYLYCKKKKKYQRAIILDQAAIFCKIGNQFCYSEYPEMVQMIQNYLKRCSLGSDG